MAHSCPICGRRKTQRRCARQGDAMICSLCCAETRGIECGGCGHYANAQLYQQSRRAPAVSQDEPFIVEVDSDVESAVSDALELAQNGSMERARARMDSLLRKHPENHMVCYGMGTLYGFQGDYQKAVEWLDKATAIFPSFVEAHFNKAVSFQKLLDVANAIRSYRKVVAVGKASDPEIKEAQSFLDGMAASIRKSDGVDLDTFLKAHDEFNAAFEHMEKKDWSQALEGFRVCVALSERHAPSHGNMGLCLAKLGRKAEALAALDHALEINPRYEPARLNRVIVERMQEGRPLEVTETKSIEFGKESFLRKKSSQRS